MIIVQLKGGLGNQLFQYAAGLSLGNHHNVPVKVDTTELNLPDKKIGTLRSYELNNLIAPPIVASQQEIESLTRQGFVNKYFTKFKPSYKRKIYNEKKIDFDRNFFNCGAETYLKGYRQSEKYFISIEKDIRSRFQLKPTLLDAVQSWSEQLVSSNSVSIHIRRGDYTNTAVNDYHTTLDEEYYQNSIDAISSAVENPTFYIFSDDIQWVKDKLQFKRQVEFISREITKTSYEDFYLMSQCKHNIIANSTFSWWAAWLNSNPNKIVIAPEKWYNQVRLDTSDLTPDSWIKL